MPQLLERKQALVIELAEVCKHLGDAQDAAIMQQEYKNKLLRQQYYNAKKEAMISLLLSQCCRQVVVEASRLLERTRLEQVGLGPGAVLLVRFSVAADCCTLQRKHSCSP